MTESQSDLRIDPSARSCGNASERDYCLSPKKRSASAEDDAPLSATSQTSNVEAGWASLQRALEAANAAQVGNSRTQMPFGESARSTMPPPSQPLNRASMPMPRQTVASPVSSMPPWSNRQSNTSWAPPQAFVDTGFDFGFSESMDTRSEEPPTFMQQTPHHDGAVQQSEWQEGLATPTAISHCNADATHVFANPEDLPLPAYAGSRRGSGADSLTANFDAFALASASPQLMPSMTPLPPSSDHLDIAARRKRPRPAALNSSALRSRSYGAMTSLSPSFRSGMTPPPHAIRQVKSTGHSLNAHFGGIRKPSSAQRSPINLSTFAEADALNHFMTQQAVAAADNTPQATPIMHVSPDGMQDDSGSDVSQRIGLATRYQLPGTQHLTLTTTSPPTTPFAAEFMPPGQAHPYMPHLAATQQYATFSDYTPPYSAGPLTNSSWSDAPLTSPDVPNFPPVTYIPSLGHTQKADSFSGSYQQFMLPSDNKLDYDAYSAQPEQKKTEFFIQEFPNQKQEHAHVAQQLAQNKPKSYIFANSAPGDYDQARLGCL